MFQWRLAKYTYNRENKYLIIHIHQTYHKNEHGYYNKWIIAENAPDYSRNHEIGSSSAALYSFYWVRLLLSDYQ